MRGGRNVPKYRHRCVVGHCDDDLQPRGHGIARQRIPRIALRWHGEFGDAQAPRLRNDHGHATVLEALGWIGAEPSMCPALVFQLQGDASRLGQRMIGIVEQRRAAFAERNDVARIVGIVDVERHQSAEAPDVVTLGIEPRRIRLLCRKAFDIDEHFDRSPIDRIEIHRNVGGVLNARTQTTQATHIRHRIDPLTSEAADDKPGSIGCGSASTRIQRAQQ